MRGYLCDTRGTVTRTIADDTHESTSIVFVQSLGVVVDKMLDAWGYEDALILLLYTSFLCVPGKKEFVGCLQEWVSEYEVAWYFDCIKIPKNHRKRRRNALRNQ